MKKLSYSWTIEHVPYCTSTKLLDPLFMPFSKDWHTISCPYNSMAISSPNLLQSQQPGAVNETIRRSDC